jgi:hypothetical protein
VGPVGPLARGGGTEVLVGRDVLVAVGRVVDVAVGTDVDVEVADGTVTVLVGVSPSRTPPRVAVGVGVRVGVEV